MTTTAIRTTCLALSALLASTIAAQADITPQAITETLANAGYTATEIDYTGSTVHAEATNGSNRIEVVFDRTTGQVLSQEVSGRDGRRTGPDDSPDDSTGSDDGPDHDAGDDHGGDRDGSDDGPDHDAGDDHGGSDHGGSDHGGSDHDSGSDD